MERFGAALPPGLEENPFRRDKSSGVGRCSPPRIKQEVTDSTAGLGPAIRQSESGRWSRTKNSSDTTGKCRRTRNHRKECAAISIVSSTDFEKCRNVSNADLPKRDLVHGSMSKWSAAQVYAFQGWSASSPSMKSKPTAKAKREIAPTRIALEPLVPSSSQRKPRSENTERSENRQKDDLPRVAGEEIERTTACLVQPLEGCAQSFVDLCSIVHGHVREEQGQHQPPDGPSFRVRARFGNRIDQPERKCYQKRLRDREPRREPIFTGRIEHAAERSDVRRATVVHMVVEQEEGELGEDTEQQNEARRTLGIQREDDGVRLVARGFLISRRSCRRSRHRRT